MTRHHFSLWVLLVLAFAIFTVASAIDMPEIAGHTLKSSHIAKTLFASAENLDDGASEDTISALESTQVARPQFPAPLDTAAKTILLIGDSMLEGIGPRMAAYADKNGHTLYSVIWYSSTSKVWGSSDKISSYISHLNPDYIFICLGANELFVNKIKERRRDYVEKIIADFGSIPFVWIGPPNWKPDTGINDLIAESTSEGQFFLSNGMSFERNSDGAHPTHSSAAEWVDSVARWMPLHAIHPIRMETPDQASGRPRRVFVHQPNEK